MLNKFFKGSLMAVALTLTASNMNSCGSDGTVSVNSELNQDFAFEAMLYNNSGDNFVTFEGHSFDIKPNKVKQWGYSTEGEWTSYYDTSSVVSLLIDGHEIDSCGSTVLFKDTRINIEPIDFDLGTIITSDKPGYNVSIKKHNIDDYLELTRWWFKQHKNGKDGGAKIILIQSQDGYNIGAVEGKDIKWEVAGTLPKTTLITVDKEKLLYIHRCNFTIIDTELFNKAIMPKD